MNKQKKMLIKYIKSILIRQALMHLMNILVLYSTVYIIHHFFLFVNSLGLKNFRFFKKTIKIKAESLYSDFCIKIQKYFLKSICTIPVDKKFFGVYNNSINSKGAEKSYQDFFQRFFLFIFGFHFQVPLKIATQYTTTEVDFMNTELMAAIEETVGSAAFGVWFLIGAALVFFMQCGFAMVETFFTISKNAFNRIMKNLLND